MNRQKRTSFLRVLDGRSRAAEDKQAFVKTQIVFSMLAAVDGHAKGMADHRTRREQLDVHKAKLAMAVRSKNAHWKLKIFGGLQRTAKEVAGDL